MSAADNHGPPLTENLGPFSFGTGLATLAIASPFMGVAVGLLETEEPAHWALRVFLFLFTLPFVLIGSLLIVGGFVLLVNTAVPGESSVAWRAPRYLIKQLMKPRHIVAALPVGLVVAQYQAVMRTGEGLFGATPGLLESGIILEFIAIHATGFLGVALLIPTTTKRLRMARFAIVALLSLMYLAMAAAEGWEIALFLAYLIAMKFGPFLYAPPDLHTVGTLALRWGFHMTVFLSVFGMFGGLESLRAGAIYWTLICIAEWLGMTEAEMFVTESEEPA